MPSPVHARCAHNRGANRTGDSLLRHLGRVESLLSSFLFWWVLCLIVAGFHAWLSRQAMNSDGMTYVDMATEALRGGPSRLVSGMWSPGYPALISIAYSMFRPSPVLEFPVVHLVNFAAFGFVLLSFTFFLKSWLAAQWDDPSSEQEKPLVISFSFCLFLWLTLELITLTAVVPDMCVAGFVFLAAGVCCRIYDSSGYKHFVALGGILGLGYYFKTVALPLGFMLIAVLFVWPPSPRHSRFRILLTALMFLLVAAPLVALVSSRVGHLSIGETGRLNSAWYIGGLHPFAGWTGGEIDHALGTPEHPPRILPGKPTILEFADPVSGTYPLWYDPSYWYAGAKIGFDLRAYLKTLMLNVRFCLEAFLEMASLFAGALLLLIYAAQQKIPAAPEPAFLWLLMWPIATCFMYGAIHAEGRYLAPFLVLFWLALYGLLSRKVANNVRVVVLRFVLCTLLISVTASSLLAGAMAVRGAIRSDEPDYLRVAAALQAAGVRRGDRLATVGYGFYAYYAHYTGTRITAHIVDANEFRYLSAEDLGRVRERLASIGVKALVTEYRPVNATSGNWRDVIVLGSPRYSIMLVSASPAAAK